MPAKRRSVAEIVGDELAGLRDQRAADAADSHADDAKISSYVVEDDDSALPPASRTKKVLRGSALRRRGPLDPTLSSGRYHAVPVGDDDVELEDDVADLDRDISTREVESNLDDIFGMLDADVDDADAAKAGLKTEEDFEEWWSQRRGKKKSTRLAAKKRARGAANAAEGPEDDDEQEAQEETGAGTVGRTAKVAPAVSAVAAALLEKDLSRVQDASDADLIKQIHALRTKQLAATSAESAALHTSTEQRAVAENLSRTHAVACEEAIASMGQWLHLRLKLQPLVVRSVRFPQYYAWKPWVQQQPEIVKVVDAGRAELGKSLAVMLTAAGFAPTSEKSAALSSIVDALHKEVIESADAFLDDLGKQLAGPSGAVGGLKALNQPVLDQIKGVIAGKARLLHRAQRNRSNATIFGHPGHFHASIDEKARRIADGNVDDEIFDDADFLRELVQHGGATASKVVQLFAQQQQQAASDKGAERVGLHRKTKGRALNFEPRSKIVGFMVPAEYKFSAEQHEALFKSVLRS